MIVIAIVIVIVIVIVIRMLLSSAVCLFCVVYGLACVRACALTLSSCNADVACARHRPCVRRSVPQAHHACGERVRGRRLSTRPVSGGVGHSRGALGCTGHRCAPPVQAVDDARCCGSQYLLKAAVDNARVPRIVHGG